MKPGCCSTCDEVREAYVQKTWAFGKGEHIEQCEREGYGERITAQRREGCRLEGVIRVNKVVGNFHIAPGRSFTSGNIHAHDLENYFSDDQPENEHHTMTHEIHQLRFGPKLPDELSERWQVQVAPPVSNSTALPNRQQRMAVTSLDRTPARLARYVEELRAVAETVRSYGTR